MNVGPSRRDETGAAETAHMNARCVADVAGEDSRSGHRYPVRRAPHQFLGGLPAKDLADGMVDCEYEIEPCCRTWASLDCRIRRSGS